MAEKERGLEEEARKRKKGYGDKKFKKNVGCHAGRVDTILKKKKQKIKEYKERC